MKESSKVTLICLIFILLILKKDRDRFEVSGAQLDTKAGIDMAYVRAPFYFIRNNGEMDKRVRFYEKGSGHATFFTREGVYLVLNPKPQISNPKSLVPSPRPQTIKLSLVGANKDPKIIGEGLQEGKVNYLIGNDPAKWEADIPTYKAIVYKEVYPGIDIKFYGNNRQMEYDIIVKPGSDPARVRFSYEGIEGLRVNDKGDLEIKFKAQMPKVKGEGIIQKRPYIYQEIDGKRIKVEGGFKVQDVIASDQRERGNPMRSIVLSRTRDLFEIPRCARNDTLCQIASPSVRNDKNQKFVYTFDVSSYDKRYPLAIDPVLVYSTYLGGSDIEQGFGIAVDQSGSVYVTGVTYSFNFPTLKPSQSTYSGGIDVFVTKLNPKGSAIVYSTYLGGMDQDYGYGIAVDSSGSAYVTGVTNSFNFPTKNPIQANQGGDYDAFVAKLDPRGKLVYSTYLGGGNKDEGRGIAIDSAGNAYVTGNTSSSNFPTANPMQPSFGGIFDAFAAKIDPAGSRLVYSTYLGGTFPDQGFGIAVDSDGSAYVTGDTRSVNFPIKNAFQENFGGGPGYDVFVTKLNSGGALEYSTFLGKRGHDDGYAVAVDSSGNAYVTGHTASINFPTNNPLQPALGGSDDAFVTKIDPTGSKLVYSTYLGGGNFDQGTGIAVDRSGNAYVTGTTWSTDFPLLRPLQSKFGGASDAFVAKIGPTGSKLLYATYLGGDNSDEGVKVALDQTGNAYVTGFTNSAKFPTQDPMQPRFGGSKDAFVAKIADTGPAGEKGE